MTATGSPPAEETARERQNRVRIGVTGLAFVFILVLLAASFTGAATSEPELTADTREENVAEDAAAAEGDVAAPQDPLAEMGVAPGAPPDEPVNGMTDPADPGVARSLEELDAGGG